MEVLPHCEKPVMILKKYFFVLSCLISFLFLSTGCTSSNDNPEDPESDHQYEVKLSFLYEGSWGLNGIEKGNDELSPYLEDYLKNGVARHLIRVYNANDVSSGSLPVASYELERSLEEARYDFTISVSLPKGDYVVKSFTDFREASDAPHYYDVTGFPHVMLANHSGLTGYQDTFSGTQTFKVDSDSTTAEVAMTRPLGRYILICEDYANLLDEKGYKEEEVKVLVYYTGFYPDTYSVITDRLTDSLTGEKYVIFPEILSNGLAIVAADFFLMNDGGSSAGVEIKIVNKNGELLATSESISIPLRRNEITVISGKLLKSPSGDGGGFDMDTGFDGDFNINP